MCSPSKKKLASLCLVLITMVLDARSPFFLQAEHHIYEQYSCTLATRAFGYLPASVYFSRVNDFDVIYVHSRTRRLYSHAMKFGPLGV